MEGSNPLCQMRGYKEKVFAIFPNLRALDGVRKAVEMNCTMEEAMPPEEEMKFQYDTSDLAWFDSTGEIYDPNQAVATRYENSTNLKREEKQLTAFLNEMQDLLKKKTNILTF